MLVAQSRMTLCDLMGYSLPGSSIHGILQARIPEWVAMWDFPGGSDGKASVYNAGDLGSIPGSGRSAGEGNGKLQYYCLESPVDRGVW